MPHSDELLESLSAQSRDQFKERKAILTFSEFLARVEEAPHQMMRNAAQYVKDTFDYFGTVVDETKKKDPPRYKLFDLGTDRGVSIIGAEAVQHEIYRVVSTFVKQGYSNKLVVLHGPNGSAKTSMVECITSAMQKYSETDEGAVYKFSWIFPTDKSDQPKSYGEAGPLGFGHHSAHHQARSNVSYAHLDEQKIASKLHSEYKENPLYLIPVKQRIKWLKSIIAKKEGIAEEDVELPPHICLAGLSKRNQQISEQLLMAYDGNLSALYRHIQVERFFYSKQYRIGVSTVEPQLSIDAAEKQLTMDRNISNLPSVLHNISFHESVGPLIESNRGLLEYSDLLKRPVEAFKYLLTTVERGTITLPTSTSNLDTVFFATTNERHLDAFKTIPDFASFRSRFELVTVPYLLNAKEEERIYDNDLKILSQTKPVAPHTLYLLSFWAVLTRLKQPDPEYYESKHRSLIARLDPISKAKLYQGISLSPQFKNQEAISLKDLRDMIYNESRGTVVYEGRFGASPREIKSILYKAVQNKKFKSLTPLCIFEELTQIVKDRTVYEFLQLEPRGKYHQPHSYIDNLKDMFHEFFEREATLSMELVSDDEYEKLLRRYVDNVVAFVKKENIYNHATSSYEKPNMELMRQIEEILKVTGSVERHREGLLGKIAAYRIDNPGIQLDINIVFIDYLKAIQEFYHAERQKIVSDNFKAMLALGTDHESTFNQKAIDLAKSTFQKLETRFGYDRNSAIESLKFLLSRKKSKES